MSRVQYVFDRTHQQRFEIITNLHEPFLVKSLEGYWLYLHEVVPKIDKV